MATRKLRVLLADDESDVRHLLRLNLELDGRFEIVGEAANGAEAGATWAVCSPLDIGVDEGAVELLARACRM